MRASLPAMALVEKACLLCRRPDNPHLRGDSVSVDIVPHCNPGVGRSGVYLLLFDTHVLRAINRDSKNQFLFKVSKFSFQSSTDENTSE